MIHAQAGFPPEGISIAPPRVRRPCLRRIPAQGISSAKPRSAPCPLVNRNRKPGTGQRCCHRGGLCDRQIFLPATRRLLWPTLHDSRQHCEAVSVNSSFIDLNLVAALGILLVNFLTAAWKRRGPTALCFLSCLYPARLTLAVRNA